MFSDVVVMKVSTGLGISIGISVTPCYMPTSHVEVPGLNSGDFTSNPASCQCTALEVAEENVGAWGTDTLIKKLEGILGSWLWPGPVPSVADNWTMNGKPFIKN